MSTFCYSQWDSSSSSQGKNLITKYFYIYRDLGGIDVHILLRNSWPNNSIVKLKLSLIYCCYLKTFHLKYSPTLFLKTNSSKNIYRIFQSFSIQHYVNPDLLFKCWEEIKVSIKFTTLTHALSFILDSLLWETYKQLSWKMPKILMPVDLYLILMVMDMWACPLSTGSALPQISLLLPWWLWLALSGLVSWCGRNCLGIADFN